MLTKMGRQQKAVRSKKQAVCYQTYMTIVLLILFLSCGSLFP